MFYSSLFNICCLLVDVCRNVGSIWRLQKEFSGTHMQCNVAGTFVQGHMPINSNVCMPVVMVTFFITLNSLHIM